MCFKAIEIATIWVDIWGFMFQKTFCDIFKYTHEILDKFCIITSLALLIAAAPYDQRGSTLPHASQVRKRAFWPEAEFPGQQFGDATV